MGLIFIPKPIQSNIMDISALTDSVVKWAHKKNDQTEQKLNFNQLLQNQLHTQTSKLILAPEELYKQVFRERKEKQQPQQRNTDEDEDEKLSLALFNKLKRQLLALIALEKKLHQ